MQKPENSYLAPDQLRIGLYVHLDLKWFEHPFAFNNFKIKDEEQIRIIRSLGLKKIRYDPARSDRPPVVSSDLARMDGSGGARRFAHAPRLQPPSA